MTDATNIDARPRFYREHTAGIVEPGTDEATCIRCGAQALLYVLDAEEWMRFTCLDCHGYVVIQVMRAEFNGQPLPPPPLPPISA